MSGNKCLEKTNNSRYCPECMQFVRKALKEACPEENRIISKIKEVQEYQINKEVLKKIKDYVPAVESECFFPKPMKVYAPSSFGDFKNVEKFEIGLYNYYVCYNDNKDNSVIFTDYEYSEAQGFLNQYEYFERPESHFNFERIYCLKSINAEEVPINPMFKDNFIAPRINFFNFLNI